MADSGGTPETTRERRQAYCDAINQALFWNEGGDLIGPSSELPVGSVQQLIWERATFAVMALAEPMAAALLAVLDLADDAARQGMGAEACFLAEDIEAAVVAAFQPKEDETYE